MELDMSQETLAERALVNQSTISQIERGEQSPSLSSFVAITEALDTSVEWLLGITDEAVQPTIETNLGELEREALAIIRSVDQRYRPQLVEFMRLIVEYRRL